MGRCKALLDVDGTPLIRRHLDVLAALGPVVVVTGAERDAVEAQVGASVVVHNPRWASTMPADSLQLALLAHPELRGVLVTPVDVAPVSAELAGALWGREASVVPRGPSGDGHPVWLGAADVRRARRQAHPHGLRGQLVHAERWSVGRDVGSDFDDPGAFQAFLRGRS